MNNIVKIVWLTISIMFACDVIAGAKVDKASAVISLTRLGVPDIPFHLYYRGVKEHNRSVAGRIDINNLDDIYTDSQGGVGHIILLDVPAGEYQFYRLVVEDHYEQAHWNSGRRFSLPFQVSGKGVDYVGNLRLLSEAPYSSLEITTHYHLSNQYEHDAAQLKKLYPNIARFNANVLENSSSKPIEHFGTECFKC